MGPVSDEERRRRLRAAEKRYAEKHREKHLAKRRRHRARHRAILADKARLYYSTNIDDIKARRVAEVAAGTTPRTPSYKMWYSAKTRARVRGLDFDISIADIVVPDKCPVLGVSFVLCPPRRGIADPCAPFVDRIDPCRGYVRGNIRVVSHRANTLKSNGTLEEFRAVVRDIEKLSAIPC